ncbi:MAG: peptide chain release factor N(5)-glutamine methyltransferase [Bacteroidota bacterium]|jgi:release factor glutamine methyltransferase
MQQVIQNIRQSLSKLYPETEISSFIRLILENVTGRSLPILLCDKSTQIPLAQETQIDKIVQRLQTFEPIQYILGETEFYGLPFEVNEHVLIPRPETEELVALIVSENKGKQLRILDIGTGSGCIAIALKNQMPTSIIEGWDFSEKALELAKLNAEKNKVDVLFKQVDVFLNVAVSTYFDIIVSNPPYVLDSEKQTMNVNVLDYEPHSALFVPNNKPLLFYDRIAMLASTLFEDEGKLYFEINQQKGSETCQMLHEKKFTNIELRKDISSNDRMVRANYSRHHEKN